MKDPWRKAWTADQERSIGNFLSGKQQKEEMRSADARADMLGMVLAALFILTVICLIMGFFHPPAHAETIPLKASWYSVESLKKEGTWKYSKGVMANGKQFNENDLTCACRISPLGSYLRITNTKNGRMVIVKVTDRIGKRFATTRVDLSKLAFSRIAKLEDGVVAVKVEVMQ
jgi:hypothetical protein